MFAICTMVLVWHQIPVYSDLKAASGDVAQQTQFAKVTYVSDVSVLHFKGLE